MDGADTWVVQLRGGARFTDEAFERLMIPDKIFRNEFQSDVAAEARIFRLVDHTHATAAEFPHDVVVGDCLANHPEGLGSIRRYVRPTTEVWSTEGRWQGQVAGVRKSPARPFVALLGLSSWRGRRRTPVTWKW